jgi:Leucine-rich repeat (LRR) protein
LNKKENIKKIVLQQNQINNIQELPNIIQPFKNLKSLDLRNNPIGKEKAENVLKKIKETDGFKEFEILYGK